MSAPAIRPKCEKCDSFVTRGFRLCGLCEWKERQKKWICSTPPCRGGYVSEHPDDHYRRIQHQFPTPEELAEYHDSTYINDAEDEYRDRRPWPEDIIVPGEGQRGA